MDVKKLREQKKMTQIDLAVKLGVSPSTIRTWERGYKPSPENMAKLKEIFKGD